MKQTEKKKDCLGKRNGPEHRENLEIHAKPGPAQGEGKKRSAGTGAAAAVLPVVTSRSTGTKEEAMRSGSPKEEKTSFKKEDMPL